MVSSSYDISAGLQKWGRALTLHNQKLVLHECFFYILYFTPGVTNMVSVGTKLPARTM